MKRAFLFTAIVAMTAMTATAQESFWTGAVDSNFSNPANWSDGLPAGPNGWGIIEGGANLPVEIRSDLGTFDIGVIQIAPEELGGELIQNGGTLNIQPATLGEESSVGLLAAEPSRWILNNSATVLYDEPVSAGGDGLDSDGTGKDFDVGASVSEDAEATLELHDNAAFRISDDLKVGDGDNGHGNVIMDGNSQMTVGSGISASGISRFDISGSALLVTGNSSSPGDAENGRTNEGYLTLSTGGGERANITVRENGKIYARTLQQRGGVSTIELSDNAEFHVFDVFEHEQPNLGVATVVGSAQGPQRTSHLSQGATAETYITLSGSSRMTIDSQLDDASWSGLALSGGDNRGGNADGGLTEIEVTEQASFVVAQDLNMTLGVSELAESTLRIEGPNANVTVGGDLRMALDEFGGENLGLATIEAVITDSSHTTIDVAGTAMIGNGLLSVQLDGYTPNGGEVYELLTAGTIEGDGFAEMSLPDLPGELAWDLAVGINAVTLSILGGTPGDFDGNGVLDAADIDALSAAVRANSTDARFDLNNDSNVDNMDRQFWVNQLRSTYFGDANLDGEFNSGDLVAVFAVGEYEDGVANNSGWAEGDWDGNGDFDSADFVVAFSAGGYEQGPRQAVAAIPEPVASWLFAVGAAITLGLFRKSVYRCCGR